MATHDVAVVSGFEPRAVPLRHVDVEVVGPELDHHRVELTTRVDGSQQGRRHEVVEQDRFLVLVQLARRLLQAGETSNGPFDVCIVDRLRTKLRLNPGVDGPSGRRCQAQEALAITRPRPERAAVQDLASQVDRGPNWWQDVNGSGASAATDDVSRSATARQSAHHDTTRGQELAARSPHIAGADDSAAETVR